MILRGLFDIFFPPACLSCGALLKYNHPDKSLDQKKQKLWEISRYLCPACIENLVILFEDICPKCGNPLHSYGCPHCIKTRFKFTAARSVFLFDDRTRKLIHGLKYYEFRKIAPVLAAYASLYLENHWRWEIPEVLIPVPLHRIKEQERGFNQSALIGRWLARFDNLEYHEDLVIRNRYTRTQTRLGRKQRQKNVAHAFSITHPEIIKNRSVLLLDDVFTTGSTCNSIAALLQDKKARQVFVLTIARPS